MSDLRTRIAQTLAEHQWKPGYNFSELTAHARHQYDGSCGICHGDVHRIADVAATAIASELDERGAALSRVRAAHPCYGPYCIVCDAGFNPECTHFRRYCETCKTAWPCPTIRAIDGDPVEETTTDE